MHLNNAEMLMLIVVVIVVVVAAVVQGSSIVRVYGIYIHPGRQKPVVYAHYPICHPILIRRPVAFLH